MSPEPPELRDHPVGEPGGQHVAQHLQHRAGPPDRDPEVVQVLGVDVGDDAVDRGVHLGQVAEQGVGHREVRGLVGSHAEPLGDRGPERGQTADGLEPGLVALLQRGVPGQGLADPRGLGAVPAEHLDPHPGRQRGRARLGQLARWSSGPGRRSCRHRCGSRTWSSPPACSRTGSAPGSRRRGRPGRSPRRRAAPRRAAARNPSPAARSGGPSVRATIRRRRGRWARSMPAFCSRPSTVSRWVSDLGAGRLHRHGEGGRERLDQQRFGVDRLARRRSPLLRGRAPSLGVSVRTGGSKVTFSGMVRWNVSAGGEQFAVSTPARHPTVVRSGVARHQIVGRRVEGSARTGRSPGRQPFSPCRTTGSVASAHRAASASSC